MDSLIEKYFNQTISPEELVLLEQELENNVDLKAQFELEKDVQAALIDRKKEDLRNTFASLENEGPVIKVSTKKRVVNYAIAALLITIIAVAGYISIQGGNLSNQEIYAANFEPYRNIIAPITRGEVTQTDAEKAFALYEMGNYEKAITAFRENYEKTGESYYIFYIANAQLALGKTNEAINTLDIHQTFNDKFLLKSKWYLALALLESNKTEKAKKVLAEISENNDFKASEAKGILDTLD